MHHHEIIAKAAGTRNAYLFPEAGWTCLYGHVYITTGCGKKRRKYVPKISEKSHFKCSGYSWNKTEVKLKQDKRKTMFCFSEIVLFQFYLTNRTEIFTTSSSQTLPLLLYSAVPQGYGLGPTSLLTYTEGTTNIFSAYSLLYHLYAVDTQTYDRCSISDISGLISRLALCISDLAESYSALRLQLNPSKTEFIWFGTRCNLNKIPHKYMSLVGKYDMFQHSLHSMTPTSALE